CARRHAGDRVRPVRRGHRRGRGLLRIGAAGADAVTTASRLVFTGLAASLLLAAGCDRDGTPATRVVAEGDPGHGRQLIGDVACGVCHIVPGVPGATGTVGPSLAEFAERNLIAGILPNTATDLARWVRDA